MVDAVTLGPVGVGTRGLVDGDVLRSRAVTHALEHGLRWVSIAADEPRAITALARILDDVLGRGGVSRDALVIALEVAADDPTLVSTVERAAAGLGVAIDLVVGASSTTLDDSGADVVAEVVARLSDVAPRIAVAAGTSARPHHAALRECLDALAGGASPCAWFVPLNPIEHAAALAGPDGVSACEHASRLGLTVVARRPISTKGVIGPLRLVESASTEVDGALTAVRRLEGTWASGLGRRIRTEAGDAVDLFRWGGLLTAADARGHDTEAWQRLRHEVIAPHVGRASAALLAHLHGEDRAEFAAWWQAYGTALHAAFSAIERDLSRVDPARVVGDLIGALAMADAPLPVRAVGFALGAGAHAVQVGIRTPAEAAALCELRPPPRFDQDALAATLATITARLGPIAESGPRTL